MSAALLTSLTVLQLVLYFIQILVRAGLDFCHRLQKYNVYVPGLQPSWFGLSNDLSDYQWKEFRNSIPLLSLVFGAFVLLSRAVSPDTSFRDLTSTNRSSAN